MPSLRGSRRRPALLDRSLPPKRGDAPRALDLPGPSRRIRIEPVRLPENDPAVDPQEAPQPGPPEEPSPEPPPVEEPGPDPEPVEEPLSEPEPVER